MRRNLSVLAGATLAVAASVCAGQELPHPSVLPAPGASQPGPGEATWPVTPGGRPPYPPPLPAVVDPRTGAWRQVYVPPGGCADVGPVVQVGVPCPRCGDKLRHPFQGRLRGALFGRHGQSCESAPDQPAAAEGVADLTGVELLPPRVPAGPQVRRP